MKHEIVIAGCPVVMRSVEVKQKGVFKPVSLFDIYAVLCCPSVDIRSTPGSSHFMTEW